MTPKQRTRIRVVQALYQWQVSGADLSQIEQQFLTQKQGKISKAFFSDLFINIAKNTETLNTLIDSALDKKAYKSVDELGKVEHAILYLGVFELKFKLEVPYKVAINEAVELAKNYAAADAFKLINTVLDKLAKSLRSVESS